VVPVNCIGTVSNSIGGGGWSGGNGGSFGVPGPVTTYTPSLADLAANTITLTLTSSGPFQGCVNVSNSFTVGFVNPPNVNPGPSAVVCTNSQSVALNGSVTGFSNTGIWNTTVKYRDLEYNRVGNFYSRKRESFGHLYFKRQ
jgi:hypothetical protein